MRIVQLITQEHGGPVDHAVDVACELAGRGHDSHLIGPAGRQATRLSRSGVTLHDAAMTGKADVRGAAAVFATIRSLRPDVVHCQDRRAGLIGRGGGRPLRGNPALVYTIHGVADGLSDLVDGNARAARRRRRDSYYYLRAERWLNAAAGGRIVVPSVAVARFAIEHVKLPEAVVDVVPNGVDVTRFVPDRRRHGQLTALWLGVMAPVKRLDVLVSALAGVPELQLRIVGDGPLRRTIERSVAEHGLADRVRFEGRAADPAAVFSGADLFVLASAAENCPLSMLQAMSAGVPVVATRVGGIPEVVRDGVDGMLVAPDDPRELARALRTMIGDPAALRLMGEHARERVLEAYTLQACVDGLLATYRAAST